MKAEEQTVVIVGSGPSGLAMAACLNVHSIPYIILEREDCYASLWKKYSYDRLHLHLAKQFSELPHLPIPPSYPTFISKNQFVQYLDDYVSHFNISALYRRSVELASYDESAGKKWIVKARNLTSGEIEEYSARFLVVASGETSNPFTPQIEGLSTFTGEVIHSTQFKNGKAYDNKKVLVVGSGNSGMEIALDLSNHGAKTSIVVRSPVINSHLHILDLYMYYIYIYIISLTNARTCFNLQLYMYMLTVLDIYKYIIQVHVLSKEVANLGLILLRYISFGMVDSLMVMLSKFVYGDLSKYGIHRPKEGPFFMKNVHGKYPILDMGTCKKIKSGEIQVGSNNIN